MQYNSQFYKEHFYDELFVRKRNRAENFIAEAFNNCTNPCLNLSGGKDSVAMLALVDKIADRLNRDFTIWSHVSDASFPGTIEIIEKCAEISGRKLILDKSPVSAFDIASQHYAVKQFGKKGYFFDAIARNVRDNKFDLCFVGVRAKESKRRLNACRTHGHLFSTSVPVNQKISYPLIWFDVDDVFATIEGMNYPLHTIYLKLHEKSFRNIRLGYVTAKDLTHFGTAVFLKRNYPDLFLKVAKVYPKIRAYV